jgi:hypothetical protein
MHPPGNGRPGVGAGEPLEVSFEFDVVAGAAQADSPTRPPRDS